MTAQSYAQRHQNAGRNRPSGFVLTAEQRGNGRQTGVIARLVPWITPAKEQHINIFFPGFRTDILIGVLMAWQTSCKKDPPGDSMRQIKTLPTEEKTRRSSRSIRMLLGGCPGFRSFGGGRDRPRSGVAWPGGWLLTVGEHSGRLGIPHFPRHGGMERPPVRDAESPERAAFPVL